jgi:hypothetical protein
MGFPNTILGAYAAAFDVDTVQLYSLGQRMETPGGRIYRYAEMGADVGVAANLYESETPSAQWEANAITTAITAGTTTQVSYTLGTTGQAENEIKEGYVIVEETADLGEIHRVAGNLLALAATPGTLYLYPGDTFKVTVAVAADNVVTTIKNPFKDIVISPASAPTAFTCGVTPKIIAGDGFGWIQTHGVASCLTDGTVIIGEEIRASESLAGAVAALAYEEAADADVGPIGRVIEVAPTTTFGTYFLTLESVG